MVQSVSLISSIAGLTASRDRATVTSLLAQLLFDRIHPQRVTVFGLIDDLAGRRVQRQASVEASRRCAGQQLLQAPDLPLLTDQPHWNDCVSRGRVSQAEAAGSGTRPHVCYAFPVHGERAVQGFVEIAIESDRCGEVSAQMALVRDLVQVFANHLAALDCGERDALTGLLGRRTLDVVFVRGRERAGSGRSDPAEASNWFAVLDIDHFKRINDTQGHLFGDEVLLILSRLIRQSLRGTDPVFRYGGEEFAVILNRISPDGALTAFERVRQGIENHRFPQIGVVTVSLGYTQIRPSDIPALAIGRADTALYYAKNNGRNRSCWFEELMQQGHVAPQQDRAEVEFF